jgi:hypothetical protein
VGADEAAGGASRPEAAPEWAPFDTGSTPVVTAAAPGEPAPAIPPVPAEELSFWDLFPEDLPPARPAPYAAEDLLAADYLALPEGPGSVAARIVGEEPESTTVAAAQPAPEEPGPEPHRPPSAPEAEIVIAELLDGPPPTGVRASADSVWAPQTPNDDFFVDDLLVDRSETAAPRPHAPSPDEGDDEVTPDEADQLAAATSGRTRDEQARIAADRARRRRSRRGGRRKPPGSG